MTTDLRALTSLFKPPCLLPAQKRVLWTMPSMVRPALVKAEFGNADLLLALSPIQHRPAYYLVWVDARWYEDQTMAYEVDAIYEAIAEEFGSRSEEEKYRWPEEDFSDGSAWWPATADNILTPRRRKLLAAA